MARPHDSATAHRQLSTLAQSADEHQEAFAQSGDPRLLAAVARAWRELLAHPDVDAADAAHLTAWRTMAGTTFLHYARLGPGLDASARASGLDEAVVVLEDAVAGACDDGQRWSASLSLVGALRRRATEDDLARACALCDGVESQTQCRRPELHVRAATLRGHVESDRFAANADPSHLDAADRAYRAALDGTAKSSPGWAVKQCHVAAVGIERWRWGGRLEDLEGAVHLLDLAAACAGDSPGQVTVMVNRAVAQAELFEATGLLRHLDRAIDFALAADRLQPGSGADNLAVFAARRYEVSGEVPGLGARDTTPSRTRQRSASTGASPADDGQTRPPQERILDALNAEVDHAMDAATAVGAVRRPAVLVNLGVALSERYDATGLLADLEGAVDAYRSAVTATPTGAPRWATRLADYADVLRERAHRLGLPQDLDLAIEHLAAAQRTGSDVAGRPHRDALLAVALLDRARTGRATRSADLSAALGWAHQSLAHTLPAAPGWSGRAALLAACLHQTWQDTGIRGLLDRAVTLHRRSLACTRAGSLEFLQQQQNLADVLAERAALTNGSGDRAESAIMFRATVSAAADSAPLVAVSAARNWGAAATAWRAWDEAAEAFLLALRLAAPLVLAQPERRHSEGWLRDLRQLPAGAAYALAHVGRLHDAVATLEAGRAVLMAASVPGGSDFDADIIEVEADGVGARTAAAPWTFDDVSAVTSSEHPIVYLTAAAPGGLALVVRGADVTCVWLDTLTAEVVQARVASYLDAHMAFRDAPEEARRARRGAWHAALEEVTAWAWQAAVGPVLAELGDASRVVLVPGGLLGLLPLHAAWTEEHRQDDGGERRYALDVLAITYAPHAKALAAARRLARCPAERLVTVTDPPHGGGTSPLRLAPVETSIVGRLALGTTVHIAPEAATARHVLDRLSTADVAHFACHGFADLLEPLGSGVLLASGEKLTLRELLPLRARLRLVVLSACETAMPGTRLPDEVVALPTGLLQAGVGGVVASQWAVPDLAAALLMIDFYRRWQRLGRAPSDALREAQLWLRDTPSAAKARHLLTGVDDGWIPEPEAVALVDALLTEAEDDGHLAAWAGFAYVGA